MKFDENDVDIALGRGILVSWLGSLLEEASVPVWKGRRAAAGNSWCQGATGDVASALLDVLSGDLGLLCCLKSPACNADLGRSISRPTLLLS